jgi:hypothetical protein
LLVVGVAGAAACQSSRPPEKFRQKLVILGFDGMDPRLVQKWMNEGRLPNQTYARRGAPAGTHRRSRRPRSAVHTGVNAGKHNIYDFLSATPIRIARSRSDAHRRTSSSIHPIQTEDHVDSRHVVLGHRGAAACDRAC